MARIEAVTFDLWDTLIQEIPGGSAKVAKLRLDDVEELLVKSGNNYPREDLEEAYRLTGEFLEDLWDRAEDVSVQEQVMFFLESIESELGTRISPTARAAVTKVYSESMLKHGPVLLAGALPALSDARKLCERTALISNTGKTPGSVLRIMLGRMGILDQFDVTVFSNEVRTRKPDRRIFNHALGQLGVDAERTIHIGDNPWADVDGAKAIGMMAIRIGATDVVGEYAPDACVRNLKEVASAIRELRSR